MRWVWMQLWPALVKAPITDFLMARSRSPSRSTMSPALPPNSRTTFFLPAFFFISQPTSGEPVKDKRWKRASVTSRLPVSRSIGSIETPPLGSAVSSMIRANNSAEMGVLEAGFKTIGHPAAMAGAILWATRLSGKLNGEMPATSPTGKYFTIASLPCATGVQSRRRSSPGRRLASSEAMRKVCAARSASKRPVLSGLAASRAMICANSSRCFSIPAEMSRRI